MFSVSFGPSGENACAGLFWQDFGRKDFEMAALRLWIFVALLAFGIVQSNHENELGLCQFQQKNLELNH